MKRATPKRVLVIDDDEAACEFLKRVLVGPDLEVVTADGAREGIESARRTIPDLIVMDLVMPGMDGLEAIREIKATRRLASVPILVLTGNADPENIRAAVDLGAEDFLAKSPLLASEAPARVRRALGLPPAPSRKRAEK